jgi:hypothetical protein
MCADMAKTNNPPGIFTILGILAVLLGLAISILGGGSQASYGLNYGDYHFLQALCTIGIGISIQLLGIGLLIIGKR